MVSASCTSAWTRSSADLWDGSCNVWGAAPSSAPPLSSFGPEASPHVCRKLTAVIGRQPLYDRGSLPGFERVTTVACLKVFGKNPYLMQPSAIVRAAGRTSSQVCLRNVSGTQSEPGVFEMAPRKASLSSSSLSRSASLAAHSGGRRGPGQAGREPSWAPAGRKA